MENICGYLLGFFFLGLLIGTVSGLKCIQCFSLYHSGCETGNLEPKNCTGRNKDAPFCTKYVGEYSYGKLTWRDCDSIDRNNTCEPFKIREEEGQVCYATCNTDGCNSAPWRATLLLSWDYLPLFVLFVYDAIS